MQTHKGTQESLLKPCRQPLRSPQGLLITPTKIPNPDSSRPERHPCSLPLPPTVDAMHYRLTWPYLLAQPSPLSSYPTVLFSCRQRPEHRGGNEASERAIFPCRPQKPYEQTEHFPKSDEANPSHPRYDPMQRIRPPHVQNPARWSNRPTSAGRWEEGTRPTKCPEEPQTVLLQIVTEWNFNPIYLHSVCIESDIFLCYDLNYCTPCCNS